VNLRTPPTEAVAAVLRAEGVDPEQALEAALAARGHIGRARRLATDPEAAKRRADVLTVPYQVSKLGEALAAADALVKAAKADAEIVTGELDEPEREAMRRAFGEGSTGKGVATAIRGAAGALRDLEGRQKSRATRVQRDSLDRALLDLAGFYRDVLAVQFGADVELANAGDRNRISQLAAAAPPEVTVRRIEAIMKCRERLAAAVAPLLAVEEMTIALVGDQRP
jgi:DNA polymerase-3 subunit delta'